MSEVSPAGVREDFKKLMHKFTSLRSYDFQEFSSTWNALKYFCIYWKAMEIRVTHGDLKEYDPMESFMKLCFMDAFHHVCCEVQVLEEGENLSSAQVKNIPNSGLMKQKNMVVEQYMSENCQRCAKLHFL